MKNFKIGKKLIVTFGIIIALFLVVVVTSFVSLVSTGDQFANFYENGYKITNKTMDMRRAIQSACKNVGYAILTTDTAGTKALLNDMQKDAEELGEGVAYMKENFTGDPQLITDCVDLITKAKPYREQIAELSVVNRSDEAAKILLESYRPLMLQIQEKMIQIHEVASADAEASYKASKQAETVTTISLVLLAVAALGITVVLSVYISNALTKPIKEIENAAKEMAEGSLNTTITYQSKDELGGLADSMRFLVSGLSKIITDVRYLLGEMANGNFNIKSRATQEYVGDYLPILEAVRNINTKLSDTLSQINESSEQVSSGSDQVSSGAQALSQGATEQASSVEELAATISEISSQIKRNAENAKEASNKTNQASQEVTNSNQKMQELIGAMSEISTSSKEIGKVIKTIEDIAFQTNILALKQRWKQLAQEPLAKALL